MCSPYVDPMAPGAIGDPPWLWVSTMAVASLDTKSRQEVGQVGAKALRQDRHNMARSKVMSLEIYTFNKKLC